MTYCIVPIVVTTYYITSLSTMRDTTDIYTQLLRHTVAKEEYAYISYVPQLEAYGSHTTNVYIGQVPMV